MNENINLCEILKDCPKGTKLYSKIHGNVALYRVDYNRELFYNGILYECLSNNDIEFIPEDKLYDKDKGEYILLPSKDQRDWSKFKCPKPKFDPKTLQPFDKVLILDTYDVWQIELFSHIRGMKTDLWYQCLNDYYSICIPYNDETKHLVGTTDEAPEYYRYWED